MSLCLCGECFPTQIHQRDAEGHGGCTEKEAIQVAPGRIGRGSELNRFRGRYCFQFTRSWIDTTPAGRTKSGTDAVSRGAGLRKVHAQQSKSFPSALSSVSSPRIQFPDSQASRCFRSFALRRLSCATVLKSREPDLHHLSHRREIRSLEIFSAPEELSHEVRALTASKYGERELRNLPPAVEGRRGFVDSRGIQCAHHLLSMSHTARAIRRPRYFFMRHLSSDGRLCAYTGICAGVPGRL